MDIEIVVAFYLEGMGGVCDAFLVSPIDHLEGDEVGANLPLRADRLSEDIPKVLRGADDLTHETVHAALPCAHRARPWTCFDFRRNGSYGF